MIVTDTRPGPDWNFDKILSRQTGISWAVLDGGLQYKLGNRAEEFKRYGNFVIFSFRLFWNRKKIKNLIAWQQYYGLFYALFCMLFHVKKRNYCMVMTFIYKERKGILEKIHFWLTKKIVNSVYIDCIAVYSQNEKEYYQKLFGLDKEKIKCMRLGLEDLTKGIIPQKVPRYVLSAGRSNRDYDFLIRALSGREYPVKIVCDAIEKINKKNIQIYDDVYYEDFFQMIADCYCVVIALDNQEISSGQLVILQAMQFGKPVIVTENRAVRDYVEDGKEGFIVPKDQKALCEKIEMLFCDRKLYEEMSFSARKSYIEKFSLAALGEQVADCIKKAGK